VSIVLEVAVILGHLTACVAAHPEARHAPPARLVAIVQAESGRRTFAIGDNTARRSHFPATREEATILVRQLIAAGHDIDAGPAQVSLRNWRAYGLDEVTVFDPAANICAGARILGEAYAIERRAACRYNTGRPDCRSPTGSNGYPERVERAARALTGSDTPVAPAEPASSLPAPTPAVGPCGSRPPSWDGWALVAHQACERRPASHPARGPRAAPVAVAETQARETD
jgi:hypothetical protein